MNDPQKTPQSPETLPELVQRARTGDQAAYTALYEATHQEIYRTVRAQVRSEELALDIQQDAYVFAFTHLDQLGDPAKFRPWLRSIAVNRTRSVLRKQTPVLFTELETEEGDAVPELPDLSPESSPELSLERKETSRLLRDILDGLTAGQRMLVGLYYYEQQPVGKIAEDLGVSPGTVKTQLSRARKKIETAVKRLEEKGVKLYGLTPLPFLLALLGRQEAAPEAGKAVLGGSLSQAGIVTESTALHVGRSFFQTALGRVWLGLLTVTVITGGVLGYRWIRDRVEIGDYQPPETVDSAEDLIVETTELPTTEPDTAEDLVPETTEPADTTEPEDTAEPTAPAVSTNPTNPAAPGPGGVDSDPAPQPSGTEPTDPSSEQPSGNEPRVVDCYWENGYGKDLFDQPWGSTQRIMIITENGAQPSLYTDNGQVLQLAFEGEFHSGSLQEGQKGYYWKAKFLGSGTAHIYCELNLKVTHVLTVTNPEYPETILEVYIDDHNTTDQISLKLDLWERISILVQGTTKPTVYTDHPEIVKADYLSWFSGSQTSWIHIGYYLDVHPLKPGTAHIYIGLNGKVYKTYTVTVLDEYQWPPETEPTDPPTEPPTEPPADPTEPTNASEGPAD